MKADAEDKGIMLLSLLSYESVGTTANGLQIHATKL